MSFFAMMGAPSFFAYAIVSTGANIVDQAFFEGLGFRHYGGSPHVNDNELREPGIDRIYGTFLDVMATPRFTPAGSS